MRINGQHYRSIRATDSGSVEVIDQKLLPHQFAFTQIHTLEQAAQAIRDMTVRGAPLIGATAAYGVALAMRVDPSDDSLTTAVQTLAVTRPTAVNLRWALERMSNLLTPLPESERADTAWTEAAVICDEDVALNEAIGRQGLEVIEEIHERNPDRPVRLLTHCNAGWLATVDWGTATAPIYMAHDRGIPVEVWVDETRPRNQGMLTAFELEQHGVPYHYIVDNIGGHLMQRGEVDMVITGCDRVTSTGDVCNKIGTYLKALAAKDNDIPFYVATPGPTIDWRLRDGLTEIPIECRSDEEVLQVSGLNSQDQKETLQLLPTSTPTRNDSFDVTPARLVTELITERGRCAASALALAALYPEQAQIKTGST